ncbi:hypothetical protein [Streptomyces sp. NPDC051577]|uniref:hypothetical protein n=1 Tax=Streptomyces sp. NPDC051577 TaxID=3155166 RepID=UPI00342D4181
MIFDEEKLREEAKIGRDVTFADPWYDEASGSFQVSLQNGSQWLSSLLNFPEQIPPGVHLGISGNFKEKQYVISVGLPDIKLSIGVSVSAVNLRGVFSLENGTVTSVSLTGILILGEYTFEIDFYRYAKGCWALTGELWFNQAVNPNAVLKAIDGSMAIPSVLPEITVSKCSATLLCEQGNWVIDLSLSGSAKSTLSSDTFVLRATKRDGKWNFGVGVALYGSSDTGQERNGILLQGDVTAEVIQLSGSSISPAGVSVAELSSILFGVKPDSTFAELDLLKLNSISMSAFKGSAMAVRGDTKIDGSSAKIALVAL